MLLAEIGVGITGFGVFFIFFGILLYFDSVLLAFGNVSPSAPVLGGQEDQPQVHSDHSQSGWMRTWEGAGMMTAGSVGMKITPRSR